jgi:FSR family fosmidomycin resistance protein-like MFS transporter
MAKSKGFWEYLLSMSHFFVDFLCTALLAARLDTPDAGSILMLAILYNGLAFAFQLPLGALGDLLDQRRIFAASGCLLVAVGSFLSSATFMCLCIGLGNALFHVGGGREALQKSEGKAAAVGRFVAPGAVGIFLGPRLTHLLWLRRYWLPGILLILAVLLLLQSPQFHRSIPKRPLSRLRLAGILGCMFFTVFLRKLINRFRIFQVCTHRKTRTISLLITNTISKISH